MSEFLFPTEPEDFRAASLGQPSTPGIVCIQDTDIVLRLVFKNTCFGRRIRLHGAMMFKMIRGNVQDSGNSRME